MIFGSKHKQRIAELEAELKEERLRFAYAAAKNIGRDLEWNKLVNRINALGGEEFLRDAERGGIRQLNTIKKQLLDPKLARKLLQLCHPDKHNNSPLSVEVTQLLSTMRE